MSRHGVRVRVPASSANLGSGLDSLGLALGLHNEITVSAAPGSAGSGADVAIEGEGSTRFATGEGNLVVRSMRSAMSALGVPAPRLSVQCVNQIPSARGLGSSAASIVAGVVAGAALAATIEGRSDKPEVDRDWALDLCARLEGHPDNVAACLLGGLTVAWHDSDGTARAVRATPATRVSAVVLVPADRVATAEARKLLPATVSLPDAAHASGRSALMVLALTAHPELLLAATEDRLHQAYRAPVMRASAALLGRIRAAGLAATISGAGPSVLVLGTGSADDILQAVAAFDIAGFNPMPLALEPNGVEVSYL